MGRITEPMIPLRSIGKGEAVGCAVRWQTDSGNDASTTFLGRWRAVWLHRASPTAAKGPRHESLRIGRALSLLCLARDGFSALVVTSDSPKSRLAAKGSPGNQPMRNETSTARMRIWSREMAGRAASQHDSRCCATGQPMESRRARVAQARQGDGRDEGSDCDRCGEDGPSSPWHHPAAVLAGWEKADYRFGHGAPLHRMHVKRFHAVGLSLQSSRRLLCVRVCFGFLCVI